MQASLSRITYSRVRSEGTMTATSCS
jgi:hypothetical protein